MGKFDIKNGIKLGYDDVYIVPEVSTGIESRRNCDPMTRDGMFPLWAAPMDTVVDETNWKSFFNEGINVIIPRTTPIKTRIDYLYEFGAYPKESPAPFVAFSVSEIIRYFLLGKNCSFKKTSPNPVCPDSSMCFRICIDIANGHMSMEAVIIKALKTKFGGGIVIVGGNIANPETYTMYDDAGCDYVRVGIGSGSGSIISDNCGINYPIFSLIRETYFVKKKTEGKCKIIADGGVRDYGDIQKALIYADYVMIGGLFNKAIESSGKTVYGNFYMNFLGKRVVNPIKTLIFKGKVVKKERYKKVATLIKMGKVDVWKDFYGMSTKKAQLKIMESSRLAKHELKTSEGKVTRQRAEFSISGWIRNEADFLRSVMSYTNSRNLDEYKESMFAIHNK